MEPVWPSQLPSCVTLDGKRFNDEEFFLTGDVRLVVERAARQSVAETVGDPVGSGDVFEREVKRALLKHREKGKVVYSM